ncbi:MAG TPA: hypothetical protein VHB21_11800, partial [Minicystis sp.]|nr:hypothetical protein [Minicystis sp.]
MVRHATGAGPEPPRADAPLRGSWLAVPAAVLVALAISAPGCATRACFTWSEAEGACPSQHDALDFFGTCTAIKAVDSAPTFIASDGLCCYDVRELSDDSFFRCGSTNTSPPGTGGFSSSRSTSSVPPGTQTTHTVHASPTTFGGTTAGT